MQLYVKYLAPDLYTGENTLKAPDRKHNWIDLRAAQDVTIPPKGFSIVPLGVAIKLPYGYEAFIAPRSSTFKTWGLQQTNSVGVVDESYCGDNDEWKIPLYNPSDTESAVIKKGDRICQFRIVERQPRFEFVEVEHLDAPDRGGFGSTGTH